MDMGAVNAGLLGEDPMEWFNARKCIDCGELFNPRHDYERRCYPCWKDWKAGWEGVSHTRPETLTRTVIIKDPRLPTLEDWDLMLPRLLILGHPDKHGNNKMSNEVTQWLLAQRRKLGS